MTESEFRSELTRVFKLNGLGSYLSLERSEKLFRLTEILLEENEKYNLTAIKEPKKIILNHYLDCAMPLSRIKKGATLIDVGCGAGFPTLPFAIFREDLKILAIDSTEKRVEYVKRCAEELGLSGVSARAMRAEDGALTEELRESFDYATARAVANLRVLSELCIPYVKPGGEFLAMKGKNAEFELKEAKSAIAILGGRDAKIELIKISDGEISEEHPLVIIKKGQKTPKQYPRPYAKISKKPL